MPSYSVQAARSAADAGLDARCKTAAARTICVDKAQRKPHFLAGDRVALAWLFDQVPVGTPVYIYS